MNELHTLLQSSPTLFVYLVFIIGLLIGSFLNVVIYRLPIMMNRSWKLECLEYLELPPTTEQDSAFNLMVPLSRCPNCNTTIKPYQNIPIVSYILLLGKCSHCKNHISLRYPLIEAFTGTSSAIIAWHFGYSIETLFALFLTWSFITLSFIDIDHQLLPDSITLPMLWLGLFLSLFSVYTDSTSSIIGAIAGYLSLWLVYQLFKLATGKEGMGYGDFKLLALLGAWLGWQYLAIIILISSLVGAIIGITMILLVKKDRHTPIPFGPYLAIAGWIALIWGKHINTFYFSFLGI